MANTISTKAELDQLLQSGRPTLIDFWATWCGPCKRLGPVVEQLAGEYEGRVNIAKCDVEEGEDLAMEFGITSIPALVYFDAQGQNTGRQVGLQPKAKIQEELDKLL